MSLASGGGTVPEAGASNRPWDRTRHGRRRKMDGPRSKIETQHRQNKLVRQVCMGQFSARCEGGPRSHGDCNEELKPPACQLSPPRPRHVRLPMTEPHIIIGPQDVRLPPYTALQIPHHSP